MKTTLKNVWAFLRANPRSTLAGIAVIASAFAPGSGALIGAVASGAGLILAADGKTPGAPQPPTV
jgi:hypothetical protein